MLPVRFTLRELTELLSRGAPFGEALGNMPSDNLRGCAGPAGTGKDSAKGCNQDRAAWTGVINRPAFDRKRQAGLSQEERAPWI